MDVFPITHLFSTSITSSSMSKSLMTSSLSGGGGARMSSFTRNEANELMSNFLKTQKLRKKFQNYMRRRRHFGVNSKFSTLDFLLHYRRCEESYQTFLSAAHHHDLAVGFKLQQAELCIVISLFTCKQTSNHLITPR